MKKTKIYPVLTRGTSLILAAALLIGLIPGASATETVPDETAEAIVETTISATEETIAETTFPTPVDASSSAPAMNSDGNITISQLLEAAAAYVDKYHLNDGMTDQNMANLYFTLDSEESWEAWSTLVELKDQVLTLSAEEQNTLFQDPNAQLCQRFYYVMEQINMPAVLLDAEKTDTHDATGAAINTSATATSADFGETGDYVIQADVTVVDKGCNKYSYTATTVTVKVTNNSTDENKFLSFQWNVAGHNSISIDGTTPDKTTDVIELNSGSSTTFTFSTKAEQNSVAYLTLSSFQLHDIQQSVNITINHTAGYGSVTYSGGTITSGTPEEISEETVFTATPGTDVKFLGWIDTNNTIVSSTATLTAKVTTDQTYTAVFVKESDNIGWFQAGDRLYNDLSLACNYVKTAVEKKIIQLTSGELDKTTYTIPSGATLLIPYSDSDYTIGSGTKVDGSGNRASTWEHANVMFISDQYDNDGVDATSGNADGSVKGILEPNTNVLRTLTIPDGATVNVESGAFLVIGGSIVSGSKGTGGICGATAGSDKNRNLYHSNIDLDGTINVSGTLSCCGYILGDGKVAVSNTGNAYQPFTLIDYHDGNYTVNCTNNGTFPASRYTMQNIQATVTISAGGRMRGYIDIYTQKNTLLEARHNVDCQIIIGTSSDSALLKLKDNATLTTTYHCNDYIKQGMSSSVAGYNDYQKIGKTKVSITGGALLGNLALTVELPGIGSKTVNSNSTDFPIPYNYDFTLKAGNYEIPYKLALLPGATIHVENEAHLTVTGGNFTVFDGLRDHTSRSTGTVSKTAWNEYHYPSTSNLQNNRSSGSYSGTANLIVDGTFTVNSGASFGGYIQTNGSGKVTMSGTPNATAGVGNIKKFEPSGMMESIAASKVNQHCGRTERTLNAWLYDTKGNLISLQTNDVYEGVNAGEHTIANYDYKLYYTTSDVTATYDMQDTALNAKIIGSWCAHNWSADWKSDGTNHWKECANCGSKKDLEKHTFETVPGTLPTYQAPGLTDGEKCTVCEYQTEQTAIDKVVQLNAYAASAAEEVYLEMKFFLPEEMADGTIHLSHPVTKNGEATNDGQTYNVSDLTPDSSGRYVISHGIASGEMTCPVIVTFKDGSTTYRVRTGSTDVITDNASCAVTDYAKLVLDKGSDAQKELITSLVTYGGYAQKLFNVDAENPAYNILTEVPSLEGVTQDSISNTASDVSSSGSSIGIQKVKQQAFLDSAIYHEVYFTLDEGYSIDDFTFILTYPVNHKDYTKTLTPVYDAEKKRYDITIEDIPAAYLDYDYKITVTNKETSETYTVTTSVLAYLKTILSNSEATDALKNQAKAMYLYNQAANTYFGK